MTPVVSRAHGDTRQGSGLSSAVEQRDVLGPAGQPLCAPPLSVTRPLQRWSAAVLAPGAGFVEDSFPTDRVWGSVGVGVIQVHYTYCALYFRYYYSSSASDHQMLDPRCRGPLLCGTVARSKGGGGDLAHTGAQGKQTLEVIIVKLLLASRPPHADLLSASSSSVCCW